MSTRPKHPKKELEQLLQDLEIRHWEVVKGSKYYRARCPCGEHQRYIHLSPSDPGYGNHLRRWLERKTCWGKEAS